jgi:hypothetical protein
VSYGRDCRLTTALFGSRMHPARSFEEQFPIFTEVRQPASGRSNGIQVRHV